MLALEQAINEPHAAAFHLMEAARFAKRAATTRHRQQLSSQRNLESLSRVGQSGLDRVSRAA
jgi:hypothetical protein